MTAKVLVQSARAPFLVLAPACVFLGVAVASYDGVTLETLPVVLSSLGALLALISINAFNEYYDFKSGLDTITDKTPFSGGSGALPASPHMAQAVFIMAVTTLILTLLVGLYFVWLQGLVIVPLGLVGIFLILAYTESITRSPYICLIAPGVGCGMLMVLGVYVALSGAYSPVALLAALVPFFLVNNLLLLNQFPDVEADKSVGRNHFVIAHGEKRAAHVFGLFMLCAAFTIMLAVALGAFPALSLLALLALSPGFIAYGGALKFGLAIASKPQLMAMNVISNLLTPVVLASTLILA